MQPFYSPSRQLYSFFRHSLDALLGWSVRILGLSVPSAAARAAHVPAGSQLFGRRTAATRLFAWLSSPLSVRLYGHCRSVPAHDGRETIRRRSGLDRRL
jgi:hypothetical protein